MANNDIGQDGQPMERAFPHNYLDNAATYRALLPANVLHRNFSLAKTQVHPFAHEHRPATPLMFCMAAGYGMGRLYLEGDGNVATLDKSLTIAIGEILAPGLPDELWVNLDVARAKLIRVVRKLMQTLQAFFFFSIPSENFVQRYMQRFDLPEGLNLPIGDARWATVAMDRGQAMCLLAAFGDSALAALPTLPQRMMVTMLISTLKKGSISDPFAQKIITGLRTEMGIDIQLPQELIRDTARIYGTYMTSEIARRVVNDWREWIPENALRLRLTVNQAVWEGLTGFNTVRRTIQALPHFPWAELASIPIYASEMEAVNRAARVIRDDEYFGFNRDLGIAGIRHYKNLASVCAAILNRALGDDQIQRAQCFSMNYAYSDRVNRIITDFINAPGEAADLNEQVRNFLNTFANNPNNPNQPRD